MLTKTILCFCVFLVPSFAHYDSAYFHSADDPFNNRQDWMKRIRDDVTVSELALPGTHDSAASLAYNGLFANIVRTQALSFMRQLEVGIRFFDIRVRHIQNMFTLHHAEFYCGVNFDQFLDNVTNFLNTYPSEVVLFRVSQEHTQEANTRSMNDTFDYTLSRFPRFLSTTNLTNVKIGNVRGRMIVMCENNNVCGGRGINYYSAVIQDNFKLVNNWDLYDKWISVRDHLFGAALGNSNKFYINYLSGSTGSFPYFVVSGHSSEGTYAPNLITGKTTPGWNDWEDFPRVDCVIGICTILFEGTNILTRDLLKGINNGERVRFNFRTVGIIVTDYPGDSLIEEIIYNNDRHFVKVDFGFLN
jgi:1-phosphatidylinositol phosphodiesterase